MRREIESDAIPNSLPNFGRPYRGVYWGMNFDYSGQNRNIPQKISLQDVLNYVQKMVSPDFDLRNEKLEDILKDKKGIRHYIRLTDQDYDNDGYVSIDWIAGRGWTFSSNDNMEVIISTNCPSMKDTIKKTELVSRALLGPHLNDHYDIQKVSLDNLNQILTAAYNNGFTYLQRGFTSYNV